VARVDLTDADLALFSDPVGTRVAIPFLTAFAPQVQPEVVLRRFEGERSPRMFRGEGVTRSMSLSMLFPSDYHQDALALESLLRFAFEEAPDGRLQLRTNAGRVGGLDPLEVVAVTSWADVPQVGLHRVFTLEATRVQYALGV
jgi:hypothetical protein